MDGCGSTVLNHRGVRARKSPVVESDATTRVTLAIESNRDHPVAIRLYDALPEGMDSSAVEFDSGSNASNWRVVDDDWLEYSLVVAPGDVVVTEYYLRSETCAVGRSLPSPVLDRVQPVDPDTLDRETAPQWRSASAGPSPARAVDPDPIDGGGVAGGATTAVSRPSTTIGTIAPEDTRQKPVPQDTQPPECMVAIPAYNEGRAIAEVVSAAAAHADCVVVIDDGSDDDTAERARRAGATVVEHASNKGYGAALQTAFGEAKRRGASHLVVIDGDGQHDSADIPRLIDQQQSTEAAIVVGSRFVGGRQTSHIPLYRRFGLWVINLLTNASMGIVGSDSRVSDTQSGFRAYDKQAIDSLAVDGSIGGDMDASLDILYHAHRHGYDIEEVGTEVSYDVEDANSKNPLSHGLVLVANVLRTIERDHPIASLGVPGFLSTLVGFGFVYWAITNYVQSGTFPLGLTVTAVFFVLLGVFACFTAIVLHSLNTHLSAPQTT